MMNQAYATEDDCYRQVAWEEAGLPSGFAQQEAGLEGMLVSEEIAALKRAFSVDIFKLLAEKEAMEDRFRAAEAKMSAELALQRELSASLHAELEHAGLRSSMERDRYLADTRELKNQLDSLRKRNNVLENLPDALVAEK
ncbi:hypothetical protein ACO0LO_26570 [Undibacterium sp. TJN25]|uniref:hypothetical protein n=1 Tax=Undibacterium sp. TJN25 TaxID=3413056 RepID=UPI003BF2955C